MALTLYSVSWAATAASSWLPPNGHGPCAGHLSRLVLE
jgi:hypothetical protein